jgi:ELWxxDGT repeat protein
LSLPGTSTDPLIEAAAGPAYRVKDIRLPENDSYWMSTGAFTQVGTAVYFANYDGVSGTELWKTDLTSGGTKMVRDIAPGGSSSNPSNLVNLNGTLFFTADDGNTGTELWKSDGTEAGTVLVKDIFPGASGSAPARLTVLGGKLFFLADDAIHGMELWTSDGAEAGTELVKDIAPGPASGFYRGPTCEYSFCASDYQPFFTSHNGLLFFVAGDGAHGY